jgi:hypothetical protein
MLKTLVLDGARDRLRLAPAPRYGGMYYVHDSSSGPATNSLQLLQR